MKSLVLILSHLRYFAPSWVFSSLNIMTGTWILYLPFIKDKFGINDGEVGMALFCLALGTLVAIPFTPFINQKVGVGRSTLVGVLFFALAYNLPIHASTYILLCAGLFITGIFSAFTDVSMNALVSTIEKKDSQNFMSAAHGFFSVGGFIGAGLGTLLMSRMASPSTHIALITIVLIISNLLLARNFIHIKESETPKANDQPSIWKSIKPLIALSILAFIVMWNEGATEHWSSIFLDEIIQVEQNRVGLGFILFSLCMTIGRFLGDGISEKFGSIQIITYGCIIASIAYLLILSSTFFVSIAGFGLLGIGLSVIIPELFRMAGNTPGVSASLGISIVSGIGFFGFLVGPVVLGFVSNGFGLLFSFGVLLVTVIISLLITFTLRHSR